MKHAFVALKIRCSRIVKIQYDVSQMERLYVHQVCFQHKCINCFFVLENQTKHSSHTYKMSCMGQEIACFLQVSWKSIMNVCAYIKMAIKYLFWRNQIASEVVVSSETLKEVQYLNKTLLFPYTRIVQHFTTQKFQIIFSTAASHSGLEGCPSLVLLSMFPSTNN